jgi:hypothetical protein
MRCIPSRLRLPRDQGQHIATRIDGLGSSAASIDPHQVREWHTWVRVRVHKQNKNKIWATIFLLWPDPCKHGRGGYTCVLTAAVVPAMARTIMAAAAWSTTDRDVRSAITAAGTPTNTFDTPLIASTIPTCGKRHVTNAARSLAESVGSKRCVH